MGDEWKGGLLMDRARLNDTSLQIIKGVIGDHSYEKVSTKK